MRILLSGGTSFKTQFHTSLWLSHQLFYTRMTETLIEDALSMVFDRRKDNCWDNAPMGSTLKITVRWMRLDQVSLLTLKYYITESEYTQKTMAEVLSRLRKLPRKRHNRVETFQGEHHLLCDSLISI